MLSFLECFFAGKIRRKLYFGRDKQSFVEDGVFDGTRARWLSTDLIQRHMGSYSKTHGILQADHYTSSLAEF